MDQAKQNILGRLKAAQSHRTEADSVVPCLNSPIYHIIERPLPHEFKANLEAIGGRVHICKSADDVAELVEQVCRDMQQNKVFCADPELGSLLGNNIEIKNDEKAFAEISIGVTTCEFLVAHTGSVLVSSAQISGRRLNVFPETHIIVAKSNQITDYLDNALEKIQDKYKNGLPSLISTITGPSRTADIEKTLVMGMHGPKSLIVIIIDESSQENGS